MPTWILTVTSRSGRPVNPITKSATDKTVATSQADLDRRLALIAADPDLAVTVKPA